MDQAITELISILTRTWKASGETSFLGAVADGECGVSPYGHGWICMYWRGVRSKGERRGRVRGWEKTDQYSLLDTDPGFCLFWPWASDKMLTLTLLQRKSLIYKTHSTRRDLSWVPRGTIFHGWHCNIALLKCHSRLRAENLKLAMVMVVDTTNSASIHNHCWCSGIGWREIFCSGRRTNCHLIGQQNNLQCGHPWPPIPHWIIIIMTFSWRVDVIAGDMGSTANTVLSTLAWDWRFIHLMYVEASTVGQIGNCGQFTGWWRPVWAFFYW